MTYNKQMTVCRLPSGQCRVVAIYALYLTRRCCVFVKEIHHLNEEIQSLLSTHQSEIGMLQQAILEKQTAINETESNLTIIGSYVDKLEERLATFAITRRDIDVREQRCKEIEERVVQAERERDEMKQKAEEFAAEHEDLKTLLDELVKERTMLRDEKEALIAERDKLLAGENALREAVTSLEQDVAELDGVAQEWRSKVVELELELGEEATNARNAQERYEGLLSEIETQQESMNEESKDEVLKLDLSEEEGDDGGSTLPKSRQQYGCLKANNRRDQATEKMFRCDRCESSFHKRLVCMVFSLHHQDNWCRLHHECRQHLQACLGDCTPRPPDLPQT